MHHVNSDLRVWIFLFFSPLSLSSLSPSSLYLLSLYLFSLFFCPLSSIFFSLSFSLSLLHPCRPPVLSFHLFHITAHLFLSPSPLSLSFVCPSFFSFVLPPTISFISHRRLSSYPLFSLPTQKEMIDTNFAVKCVLHVENLFAADMLSQESSVQRQLHIERNVSLRIQYWLLSCTVRRKWQKKTAWGNAAVRKALLARAIATTLRCKGGWKSVPSMDYTIPMEIEKVQPSLWPRGLNPASTPRGTSSACQLEIHITRRPKGHVVLPDFLL